MSTDEDSINTSSIEEMINANLGIDPNELAEAASSEAAIEESAVEALTEANTAVTDNATEDVLKSIDIDALLNDASDDDTAEPIAEETASEAQEIPEIKTTESIAQESENTASPEIIVEAPPSDNSEADTSTEEGNAEITAELSQETALDDLLSSAMEEEPADTEPAIEAIIEPAAEIEEQLADDQPEIETEEATSEAQEIPEEEPAEGISAENENTPPKQASEIADNTDTDTSEETEAVTIESEAPESLEDSLPDAEAIQSLETEVAELDSEIQTQIDQFAIQADHLKANIQGELQRVCSDNEQLHKQIKELEQQLLSAEDKIQGFTEIQDKQQVTIHKLILIVKGIRSKISHLYDE